MDGYALLSRIYDGALEPLNAPMRRQAHRVCPSEPGMVVLDVGCGTGTSLAEYAAQGCTVIGLDTSPAMIEQARRRLGPDADVRQVTGGALPVPDGCADLVVISLVLHSVPRPDALGLLAEAARALAPGGRILITDFGGVGLRFPRGHVTRAVSAVTEVVAGPRHARCCLDYLRSGGLPSLLAEAGLDEVTVRPTAGGNITITVARPAVGTA
jgi:ubiquinone/menaquinone biosynthesis C-methylase UbiE